MNRRRFAQISALLAVTPSVLAQQPPPRKRARMFAMASESLFAGVNRNDAVVSLRVWAEALTRRLGYEFNLKLDVFDSPGEAIGRLKSGGVDLLFLDTPDYASIHGLRLIEPVASGSHRGLIGAYEYLLLCREAQGIEGLPHLQGKRVGIASRTGAGLGAAWLDVLLASHRLEAPNRFFQSVALTSKASACVLPVFFGRLDACVVDANNFATMKELNPQLGRLKVLARSQPMVEGMIAFALTPHPFRDELIQSLLQLHKDPAGAQMVMLFKTGPLVRATADDFEAARAAWEKSQRLGSGTARAAVPAAAGSGGVR